MKTALLLFFCFIKLGHDPMTVLMGKWKLQKIESEGKTILPQNAEFDLTINKTSIGYYDGCNNCGREIVSVNDSIIVLGIRGCTKRACRPINPVTEYLDYSGSYMLHDSILLIINPKGTLYLIRQ